jgi:hypothetical protein
VRVADAARGGHTAARRTVVVLQPGYLPWLGFFDQVHRSDVFVFLDHVQFDRRGWRHRNRVKGEDGRAHWLTVPVRHRGAPQRIVDVAIHRGTPWARKQVSTIRQCYRRAPYLDRYLPELEELIAGPVESLAELDIALARLMCGWLGISASFARSSELGVPGRRTELLMGLCRHFGATHYLSGNAAKSYLDVELMRRNGIEVAWHDYRHPVYPQQHGAFVPYLSALDLLLNCGDDSSLIVTEGAA